MNSHNQQVKKFTNFGKELLPSFNQITIADYIINICLVIILILAINEYIPEWFIFLIKFLLFILICFKKDLGFAYSINIIIMDIINYFTIMIYNLLALDTNKKIIYSIIFLLIYLLFYKLSYNNKKSNYLLLFYFLFLICNFIFGMINAEQNLQKLQKLQKLIKKQN